MVSAFWWTVAANLAVLWVATPLALATGSQAAAGAPLVSLALTVAVGVASLARADRRRLGAGVLAGAATSAALMMLVLLVVFVAYFVVGGHELS